jgi:hypothetical protein
MLSALKTKRARAGLAALALLAFAGAAVAYFTATGSGSGSATVGTSSAMTITATVTPGTGGLVPGGNPADVSFSVNNPGKATQHVGTVTMTGVTAYTDNTQSTPVPGCSGAWFAMTPVAENQEVGSGNTSLGTDGSLQFNDVNSSQDACKGVYLVASFTSN